MKIEKFLVWIQKQMLNYPDISYKTLKIFIDKFECMLSKKETEKFTLLIQIIKEYTLKQITIDTFVNLEKTKHLENELNNLKGVKS